MFEAKLAQASIMKKIIDAIKDMLNEASFDCSENAIALQAMDSSHVALVSLKLDSNGFETYRNDRTINLGINLAHLAKIVKCAGNDDTMTIRFQDESDSLVLLFENENQDRQSEYEMKLMDLDAEHLGIPDQDYACVVKMPAGEFQRICRDLSQMGDSLSIVATKNGIEFSTKGDMGSGKVRLAQTANADNKDEAVSIDLKEPVNITFAVKYLNNFTKATPLSSQVTLSMSNDVPIVVEYHIGNDEAELGYIRYYLAPKIDEEAQGGGDN